ncbi:MAG TPA: antitoxin Xre/MbcA/ParS toxin-binding domain-containing protein [Longimicrobium sp.]|nr:antitoxin Xre/MbcA/ParS toxin-binding domain-containing protein [Longimicrobium sp.]
MTKAEFVSQVAEKAHITRAEAVRALDAVLALRSPTTGRITRTERPATRAAAKEPASLREIRALALQVWENAADAEEFLSAPHGLLDGETPVDAARTPEGATRVHEILLALEYGLPV